MSKNFKGKFEFFCKPTKTADNKKTIVELTGEYNLEAFCQVQEFWDQKIRMSIIKEQIGENLNPKKYDFIVLAPKVNKGAKDNKTYTIILSKLFDHDEHIELCEFLHYPVAIEWTSIQPEIDFDDFDDPEED